MVNCNLLRSLLYFTMYNIGIVGYGVVGKGILRLFKEEVIAIYDPFSDIGQITCANQLGNRTYNFSDKKLFTGLNMVVISVPTNQTPSGRADTQTVWESLFWLSEIISKETIILIKSTTPPSELKKMSTKFDHIVFSPEYMGESKYFTPFWKYPDPCNMESHTWQIFGGSKSDTSKCVDYFKCKMGVDTVFYQVDLLTACLCKYMENSFFAMKVTFCNEWYDIAKNYGVDYNELRECWLADSRINRNHTLVFTETRGYGGKCFPKDTKAIIYDAENVGYSPELMKSMDKINSKIRKGKQSINKDKKRNTW